MKSPLVAIRTIPSVSSLCLLMAFLWSNALTQPKVATGKPILDGKGNIVVTEGFELKTLSGGIREPVRMVLQSPQNARKLYAVTASRIVVSGNRGETWATALALSIGEVPQMIGIEISSPNLAYCEVMRADGKKAYYLSKNGGRDWVPVLNAEEFGQFIGTADWLRPG